MERHLSAIFVADVVGYSRLMRADEEGTLLALRQLREDLINPQIAEHHGRIIKLMGDGILVEFASAVEAVTCGATFQNSMAEHNANTPHDQQIVFRIGINLGDVIIDGDDIQGDGVNIAARLEAICPSGGICVSELIKNTVESSVPIQFEDFGKHRLKNIEIPVQAYLVSQSEVPKLERAPDPGISWQSPVRYCRSKDGTSIAHAVVGEGYPLVLAGSWMTHLEWDWEAPSSRDYVSHLCKLFTVIRYDQRGNGMSDWDDVDISFDKMVDDMEVVIDQYDFERVAILGCSQGAPVAVAYSIRRPEKVSHLVLNGGYARGRRRRGSAKDEAESEALVNMIRYGWATENPAFRQAMTTLFMPDASPDEVNWFNAFQKACGPGENMARFREMFDEMDVSDLLGNVKTPTLVIHSDGDAIAPISEGKFLASRIPEAQFVQLKSNNHMMFGNEPDFPKLIGSITKFVNQAI